MRNHGFGVAISENELVGFIEDVKKNGSKIYSVKKLSTIRKKLYGWGKYEGDFYTVDVVPMSEAAYNGLGEIIEAHRRTLNVTR